MNKIAVLIEASIQMRNLAIHQNRYKYCQNCGERDKQSGEWKEVGIGEGHRRICTKCNGDLDAQMPPF